MKKFATLARDLATREMKWKAVSGIVWTLILIGMLAVTGNMPPIIAHTGTDWEQDRLGRPPLISQQPPRVYNITVYIYRVKEVDNLDYGIWPFHNDADFFTTVTIDGVTMKGPKINGRNDAFFEYTFSQEVEPTQVSYTIIIEVWESDEVYDDHCDINPSSGRRDLILTFNAMSYHFTEAFSDVQGQGGVLTEVRGEGDSDRARVWFTIDTADGRPFTEEDIAATKIDAVQVVFGASALVSGKPTMVMTRVVNNFKQAINTEVRVTVSGAASRTVDVKIDPPLDPWEVRIMHLFLHDPIIPDASVDQHLRIRVEIDPDDEISGPGIDPDENNVVSREWKVRPTRDLRLLYQRVNYHCMAYVFIPSVSNVELAETARFNSAFIHGTYPTASVTAVINYHNYSYWTCQPIEALAINELLQHLTVQAPLLGYTRVIGVVDPGWFDGDTLGVAFLDAGAAALMEPNYYTIAAHEIGHTYGLSVDPRLGYQMGWLTYDSYDEYLLENNPPEGNPASGCWLAQGGEPSLIAASLPEMRDSHCFMGTASDPYALDRWIDNACYEHLMDRLAVEEDPEVIHVSGIIFKNDSVHLNSWYRLAGGFPDSPLESDSTRGLYVFRFIDEYGEVLGEAGLEKEIEDFNNEIEDFDDPIPLNQPQDFMPFALTLPFPSGTSQIQIVNKTTNQVIATRVVSKNPPSLGMVFPEAGQELIAGENCTIEWTGEDADGDPLTFMVAYSDDAGESWLPLATLNGTTFTWQTRRLVQGNEYFIKVIATDGVNTGETVSGPFSLIIPLLGDINSDGTVNIFDVVIIAKAFGSIPEEPLWNPDADLNNDGVVDIFDVIIVAKHFGETL